MPLPLQIAFKPIKKPEIGINGYRGFFPDKSELLPKGWSKNEGRALECDIRVDHDVEVKVRDGCRLYVDVYRPADRTVPAILSWSAYGKKYSTQDFIFTRCTWNCCIKREEVSGLEQLEGLDPAWWCARGYACVNVDSRGVNNSDGQIPIMGTQDAEDAYDVIECVARMDWCNGKVGMAGNSALAIAQWHTASLNPPSLKAIAPWEGCGDLFREQFCRGGVFSMSNFDLITDLIVKGGSGVEDFAEMYRRSPLSNAYWEDKRAKMRDIKIPTFVAGSDFSGIHTMGAIRGYLEVGTADKWIRWNAFQEWFDLYSVPESYLELQKFFDKFLKGIDNGFEETPKVRWTALKFGDREAESDIILPDFPVPNTSYRKFYLGEGVLTLDYPTMIGTAKHASEDPKAFSAFEYQFPEATRLIGLPKAVLYMSCPDHDDMNVFVLLRKLDKHGTPLLHLLYPFARAPVKSISEMKESDKNSLTAFMGPTGVLRASHRKMKEAESFHPMHPFHPHDEEEKIEPGQIVKLEIGLWAMGIDFEEGERLKLQVHGQYPSVTEFGSSHKAERPLHERNKGQHIVHFGMEHQSHLILPVI